MRRTSSLVLALLAALAAPAEAWETFGCTNGNGQSVGWTSPGITLRFSSVSFPAGPFRDGLQTVVNHWNQNPSAFRFSTVYGDTSVAQGNLQNETWFSNDPDWDPAATALLFSGLSNCNSPHLVEADVVFYAGTPVTTSMLTDDILEYAPGGIRPFQTEATHELGHALGLDHESGEYNIMGQDYTHVHANGGNARSYAGEDASDGAVALYGSTALSVEDLSVAHWRFSFGFNGYSQHFHTGIFDAMGNLKPVTGDGTAFGIVSVAAGETIQVEFTYENSGKTTQTTDVGIYLSTNDLITTHDQRLGGFSLTLARNGVVTTKRAVTIPVGTTPGEHWIGPIIDENGTLTEVVEANNATWLHLQVN